MPEHETNPEQGAQSDNQHPRDLSNELSGMQPKPDSRLDHDAAWDIGHASKDLRSREAYFRQAGQIGEEYLDRASELNWRDHEAYPDRNAYNAARDAVTAESQQKLDELNELYGYKRTNSGGVGDVYRTVEKLADDILVDRRLADDEFWQEGPEVKAREAAEDATDREFWAEKIHQHPELAGDKSAKQLEEMHVDFLQSTFELEESQRLFERLQQLCADNAIGVAQLDRWVAKFYGNWPRDQRDYSPVQREFAELSHKDETTVGELKRFVIDRVSAKLESWRADNQEARARWEALRS